MRARRSRASARLPLSSAWLALSRSWVFSISLRFSWLDFSIRSRFFSSESVISLRVAFSESVIILRVLVLSRCWYLASAVTHSSIGPSTATMMGQRSDNVTASMTRR